MSRRTAIALILGLAAMQAAIPLADFLNELIWREYFSVAAGQWGINNITGRRNNIVGYRPHGDLSDPEFQTFLFPFLQYIVPSLLFMLALRYRIRAGNFFLIGCFGPSVLVGIGATYFTLFPPVIQFVHALLFGILAGTFGAIALKVAYPTRAPISEDRPAPIEEGAARNPWRAWLILTFGFFLLQTAMMLSIIFSNAIWVILAGLSPFWRRSIPYSNTLKLQMEEYDFVAMRYASYLLLYYLIPFLLLALAVYLRMRPRYGWLLGLLLSVLMALQNWAVQTSMTYYDAIRQVLFGQICGAMIVFLLWMYHRRVTKIEFDVQTDE